MNLIKKIFPVKPDELVSEFRVVPYADRSYVLEYKQGRSWREVWEARDYASTNYSLPMIDRHPASLIARGEEFKANPGSLEKFLADQVAARERIIAEIAADQAKHDSFSHYI